MANRISGGPVWMIDTAGEIAKRGVPIRPKGIRWVGAGTAGDSCVIRDCNGCTCWESVANVANFEDVDAPTFTMNGFVVATLSSGRLYVEVE